MTDTHAFGVWQPVETAPRDGTDILVVGGMHKAATIMGADGEWWRSQAGKIKSLPTHWMRLPEPPEPAP